MGKGYFLNEDGSLMYESHEARANIFDWLYRERKERASTNRKEWIENIFIYLCAGSMLGAYALCESEKMSWWFFGFVLLLALCVITAYAFIAKNDGE